MNAKSMPAPEEWREKVDAWVRKMGYHISLDFAEYDTEATKGSAHTLKLGINNIGVAPIYKDMKFGLRLKSGDIEYSFDTDVDVRKWLPGKSDEDIVFTVAKNVTGGTYELQVGIISELFPVVYLATDAIRDGAYYTIGSINII